MREFRDTLLWITNFVLPLLLDVQQMNNRSVEFILDDELHNEITDVRCSTNILLYLFWIASCSHSF